jgi:hypothetical protein
VNGAFTIAERLGSGGAHCHGGAMAGPKQNARSGGALLALSIVAGAVGGVIGGQASIGFLAGLAVGLALLGAVWLADRKG